MVQPWPHTRRPQVTTHSRGQDSYYNAPHSEANRNKTHSRGQPQHNASHSKANRHMTHSRGHIRYNHGPTLEGRKSRPTLEVKTRTTTPRSRGRQYQDPLSRSNHIHIASLSKANKEKNQRPALEVTHDTTMAPLSKATTVTTIASLSKAHRHLTHTRGHI